MCVRTMYHHCLKCAVFSTSLRTNMELNKIISFAIIINILALCHQPWGHKNNVCKVELDFLQQKRT